MCIRFLPFCGVIHAIAFLCMSSPHQNNVNATTVSVLKVTIDENGKSTGDTGRFPRVFCAYTTWAWYRKGSGQYKPEDIDPTLCTDVNFAYLELDRQELLMRFRDAPADQEFLKKVLAMKSQNPSLKVHASLGGWGDSGDSRFTRLIASMTTRKNFIKHATNFLRDNQFDGLDVSWMFPKCWRSNCNKGPSDDPQNFAILVAELYTALKSNKPPFTLSVTVSGAKEIIDKGYDIPSLIKNVDFLHVMTYDFAGNWFRHTGFHAQLFDPTNTTWTVSSSLKYWQGKGVPFNKMTLSIPTYGRTFTLDDPEINGLRAPAKSPGRAGEFTREKGRLAYFEICQHIKNDGWNMVVERTGGTYAFHGNQWTGYDGIDMVGRKAKYAKALGLGGVLIWDITMDDFKGRCCAVKNPMLEVVNYVFRGQGTKPSETGCETGEGIVQPRT